MKSQMDSYNKGLQKVALHANPATSRTSTGRSIFLSFFLSFFLIILSLPTLAQTFWEDAHPYTDTLPKTGVYSYFGGAHTPRGDLKILVLTIGFDGVFEGDTLTFPGSQNIWPVHSPGNQDFQGFPKNFDDVYYSSPGMFSPSAGDVSVSNFYYQQSRTSQHEPFRVTYEFFPHRINVPILPTDAGDGYFYKFIARAYDTIQARFSDASWYQYFSRFDQRTNSNYQFDNSVNPTPDGKIDYMIILFRFNGPPSGNPTLNWMTSIKQDGYAGVSNKIISFPNGNTITFNKGFTAQKGFRSKETYASLFIHEDAHVFYNAPHVFGANAVVGDYFYTGSGWSSMNAGGAYYSQNAWERWWLDWLIIKHDLSGPEQNGDYWLEDFISTGDAMRLKLPTPGGQYVWFENRTGHTPFDRRLGWPKDGAQNPIPPASHGVIGFVEAISDNKSNVSIGGKTNALKALNPNGNFDYTWSTYRDGANAPEWYGNRIYNFTSVMPNSFGAHNSLMEIRDDYFGDSIHFPPNGIISIDNNSNSSNVQKREHYSVIELEDKLVWGPIGYNLAFPVGTKISISSNPGLFAQQKYYAGTQKLDPIYLHGLSVQVMEYQGSGVNRKAKIRVKYDDFEIDNDVRWTGNIILPVGVPLVLKPSMELLLDKSGTPNRNTLTPAGDFINPTVLTFKPGATFNMDSLSVFRVTRGSSLTLENGSKLSIGKGAVLIIENGSILSIENCAEIEALSDGLIVAKEGAILKIAPNAILNLHEGQAALSIAPGVIIPNGFVNPLAVVPPAYHIAKGQNTTWASGNYHMVRNLNIEYDAKLTLNNYTLRFDANCGITVAAGAQLSVLKTTFTNSEGCRGGATWRGITIEGDPLKPQEMDNFHGNLTLGEGTAIEHALVGVNLSNGNGTGGGVVQVNGATFTNNITAISFAPYRYKSLPNLSFIKNSSFITTGYLIQNGLMPHAHIGMQNVSQIKVMGNVFLNKAPDMYDINNRGFGVYASNSDIYIANYCEHKPCVTETPNVFSGLTTGVQSVGVGSVPALLLENATFNNCYTGVSVSGVGSPVIKGCQFQVPNYSFNNTVSSGINLNVASTFTLKANSISGQGSSGTGVNLYNLSQPAGSIEGNIFSNLRYGLIADGYRGKANLTCNTFMRNSTDVYLITDGISRVQGSPSVSASNSFLTMCGDVNQYHILSPNVPITYYGHRSDIVYNPKCNEGSVYVFDAEALANCGGDFFGDSYKRFEAFNDTIAIKHAELTQFEDEGTTDNLMLAVENAVPGNPLPLLQRLLNASPVLSDSVMVAATNRFDVLPDAFITRVLSSNPQAPKSSVVNNAIVLRPNSLPDYLLQAIKESGNELSAVDIAKGNLERLRSSRDQMLASMAGRMLNDTLSKTSDTLGLAINLMPTATTIALKAMLQFEKGKHIECMEAITMGMEQVGNSTEADELEGLIEFLTTVSQTSINDSTYTDLLNGFAESTNKLVGLLAKNALLDASAIPIHAPLIEYDSTVVPRSNVAQFSPTLSVSPVKATNFVVVKYDLFRVKPSEVLISIKGSNGVNYWMYSPKFKAFEEVVVTEGWAAGLYNVQLMQGGKVISSKSFNIVGINEVEPIVEIASGNAFYISPNPAKNSVTLSLSDKYAASVFTYSLISSKGEILYKGQSVGKVSINIDKLLPSIYLVRIHVDGQEFTERLVKE